MCKWGQKTLQPTYVANYVSIIRLLSIVYTWTLRILQTYGDFKDLKIQTYCIFHHSFIPDDGLTWNIKIIEKLTRNHRVDNQ